MSLRPTSLKESHMVDYQIHPRKNTPCDAKSATTDWDNTGEIALPADTVYLVCYATENVHLIANSSSNSPDTDGLSDGAVYAKEQTHIIECPGKSYLHHKGLSASATLYVTAFHN